MKVEYPEYFRLVRPFIRPGGIIAADNVLRTADAWIDHLDHPSRRAVDELNRMVAADPEFETVVVPLREGVLVALKGGGYSAPTV